MSAKSKRIMSREINKIFRLFSVDFEYALPSQETDVDDQWGDETKTIDDLKWLKVREPLISVSNSANTLVKLPGGDAASYSWEWLSRMQVPDRTIVSYHKQQFSVVHYGDVADIAGVYLYFLQGRSDHVGI